MHNDHYSIFRWGSAQMWWIGSAVEIAEFKAWVEQYVPQDAYDWFTNNKSGDPQFDSEHLSGVFEVPAWTFLLNWWSGGLLGRYDAQGQFLRWKLAPGPIEYESNDESFEIDFTP